MENIGLIIGFILTLMVFSYVLGDNLLYRLAVYVFVGLVAGYTSVLTVESVLIPWFSSTLNSTDPAFVVIGFIPLALGLLLLVKSTSRLGRLGNLAIGLLIGIGASVAVVGALTGTLIPLALDTATIKTDDAVNSLLLFVGVVSSLIYFQYIARRDASGAPKRVLPVQIFSVIGEGVIVVTLGVIYAAAIITSLTIFSERMGFLLGGL
jgi:hypothetical protein